MKVAEMNVYFFFGRNPKYVFRTSCQGLKINKELGKNWSRSATLLRLE